MPAESDIFRTFLFQNTLIKYDVVYFSFLKDFILVSVNYFIKVFRIVYMFDPANSQMWSERSFFWLEADLLQILVYAHFKVI